MELVRQIFLDDIVFRFFLSGGSFLIIFDNLWIDYEDYGLFLSSFWTVGGWEEDVIQVSS